MALTLPVGVAHDAPVAGRVVEIDGQHGQRARVGGRDQLLQGGSADQRHVAVQHQHGVIVRYDAHGLHHGMTGAQLLGLQHPVDGLVRQRRLHLRAAVSVHHVDIGRLERARRADHVLQQRLPRQAAAAPSAGRSSSACPGPRRV